MTAIAPTTAPSLQQLAPQVGARLATEILQAPQRDEAELLAGRDAIATAGPPGHSEQLVSIRASELEGVHGGALL